MELDNRKKGLILLAAAGGVFLITLSLLFLRLRASRGNDSSAHDAVNVYVEVPNGEERPLEDSKLRSYRNGTRSRIEDYWDDMGAELGAGPDVPDGPDGTFTGLKAVAVTPGPRTYTAEDVFGGVPQRETGKTAESTERPNSAERREVYLRERQAALDEVMRRQEELIRSAGTDGTNVPEPESTEEEPRDRIDVDHVLVRRSGSVTSLEEAFTAVTGSGISTLEGEDGRISVDEAYPFKCMFVRSEKLRSGGRVSVRLLEDMVIDGQLVPRNTHLMAVCSIGTRVDLNVSSIDLGGKIINLDYDAYDNDGTKGIYCPGISDASVSRAVGSAVSGARSRLSSRLGRAAQDVVNTGLSLITLSGGETAVQIPAGYQFYLVKSRNSRTQP